MGLSRHLLLLVMVVLAPALLLGVLTTAELAVQMRGSSEARLDAAAESARQVLEREINGFILGLSLLAAAAPLDQMEVEAFRPQAEATARLFDSWVILYSARDPGVQLLNTRHPPDAPPTGAKPGSPSTEVFRRGVPVVSDMLIVQDTGAAVVAIAVPVSRLGETIGVLVMPVSEQRLTQLLRQVPFRQNGALIVSSSGQIVARTEYDAQTGDVVPQWLRAGVCGQEGGLLRGQDATGVSYVAGFRPLVSAGWYVVLLEDALTFEAGWRQPAMRLLLLTLVLLVKGVLAAIWLARRLVRPLNAQAPGTGAARGMARVAEFEAMTQSVQKMRAALQQEADNSAAAAAVNLQLAREAQDDRRLLSSVMQSVPDSIFVKDMDLRYVLINEAGAAALGLPIEAVIGRTDGELRQGEAAVRSMQADVALLATDEFRETETTAVMPNGRGARTFLVVKGPWRDGSGRVAGLVGVARDVTERRATERRLARAEEAMRRIARADSMAAMSVGLAHELNQPLTAAGNFLRAANRLLADDPPRPARVTLAREAMAEGAEQVLRAGQIIQRLRDFIGRGKTDLARLELGALAIEAVALARAARGPDAIQVPIVLEGKYHAVLGDAVQLQQVLVNLLRNAMEAVEGRAPPRVILRLALKDGAVRLEVEDNGPGMAPEILERLFEPFATTKQRGMGIGLSICRAIVEAHHGSIEALTPEGGGTVLRVTLPMVEG